ncbi:MAG TPA: response regulator [Pyrinomonadaceae bacterium]|nr:response regulator [Pyrinomonadaceae bacterium]
MSTSRCRILYIDDHQDSAEMLRLLLSDEHEVVIATSIKEAIELVKIQSFDLYVLDRRLPDGTGMELCTLLNEVTPHVPCIFYTGDAYEVHRQQALAAGAQEYVSKPNIEELIETVTRILAEKECAAAS